MHILQAAARVRAGSMPKVYFAPSALSPMTGVHFHALGSFQSPEQSPRTMANERMLSPTRVAGVPVHMAT